jgi:microcystin-dependent protein
VSNPFLGEVRLFGFGFAPKGWAICNGALLGIAQNAALFSLLGTQYGGNGTTNFGLPNLQGRVPIHRSNNGTYQQGQVAGTEQVNLSPSTMPMHTHMLLGTTAAGNVKTADGTPAASPVATDYYYSPPTNPVQLNPASVSPAGGGQAHPNLQPFLAISYCIALTGIFPSRG